MNNQKWHKTTIKRKPICIDKNKKTENTSSVVENNKEKKKGEVYSDFNNIKKQQVSINKRRSNISFGNTKKHKELFNNVKKDVSNLAYSSINYSGDSGSEASVSVIKMKAKLTKTSFKVVVKSPKGVVVTYKGAKHTYKKIKTAPRRAVKRVKQIKTAPRRVVNTVKHIPARTVKVMRSIPRNVKRKTIKTIKAVPLKTYKGIRAVPKTVIKGAGKGINFAGNTLSNSNDIGIKSVGYSIKLAQYNAKITKAVKNLTKNIVKGGMIKLFAPAVVIFIIILGFWNNIDGIVTAIAELLSPHEEYYQAELTVLSNQTHIRRAGLVNDLNDTIIDNLPNPAFPNSGYHIFYYKTASGLYVPLENASDYFLSENEFKNLIKPLLHISLLIDFDCEFNNINSYSDTLVFHQDNFDNTFIRGANYNVLYNSMDYQKIEQSLNQLYGEYNGWKRTTVTFFEYVEMVYDMIWESIATVVTEPLPTEWCVNGEDVESGYPYASVDCLNHSHTLYHSDDLSAELNSCDYYYYLCKGTHKVFNCSKETHTHSSSCKICSKEEHTHIGDCYGWLESGGFGLKCGKEAHTHNSSCYTCGKEAHTHNSSCYEEVYHSGELAYDCGNATKHRGCNGYQVCMGHRVLALSLDYASLEELEQKYIVSRINQMEMISWSSEAIRLQNYYEFYMDSKNERFD